MGDTSQFVLTTSSAIHVPQEAFQYSQSYAIWAHPLMIPAYVAIGSAVILATRILISCTPLKKLRSRFSLVEDDVEWIGNNTGSTGLVAVFKAHVHKLGGPTIYSFKFTRLLTILVLVGLSVTTFIHDAKKPLDDQFPSHQIGHHDVYFTKRVWLDVALCLTYLYALILATLSVAAGFKLAYTATRHLNMLMLVTFGIYMYRDLWPLATFTLSPEDELEGPLLWAKIAILSVAAVIIPLTVPRQYIPFDPKASLSSICVCSPLTRDLQDPAPEPNPEQTASILSFVTYTFLDPIVFLAYRVPHLSLDKLPPLADYDYARNLVASSFKHLDTFSGAPKRHVFWGIMKVFRREYTTLAILVAIRVVTAFFAPVGIKGLLGYLETRGEDAVVRPWVWISALLLGPLLGTLSMQGYIFIATALLVRTEGIFTHLIFEHALRIRVKAETETKEGAENPAAETSTPDSGSVAESSTAAAESTSANGVDEQSCQTTNGKGKQKAKDPEVKPAEPAPPAKDKTKEGNLIGKINNLVSTDLTNITDGRDFLFIAIQIPFQSTICVYLLYKYLGWSAFVGVASMIILFPVPGRLAQMTQKIQKQAMKKTDARVQNVTEAMSVLRMIKLFGWEPKIDERVAEKRDEELAFIRKRQLLGLLNNTINYIIPVITMVVTFGTYTAILKQELKPSTVFSSMAIFDLFTEQLHRLFFWIPRMIQAKVSADRVTEYLQNTELLDEYTVSEDQVAILTDVNKDALGFANASFTWANDEATDGTVTPSRRKFVLRIEDELIFKKGCFNLIIGPTGSGKTSLLMALLGEMHFIPLGPGSWYNLPREGGIAYAAQESWVQNETIKSNILFGAEYDEARYNKVIYQCGLKRDLSLFDAGDNTEVGEKGLTLSGGQKARITLARAVYSSAETILLDDVLAALDVHTARWIVQKCFKGELLRGRTVLLVTHNVAMASPIADYVVSLGSNGTIASRGSVSDAITRDDKLQAEFIEEEKEIEQDDKEIDAEDPDAEAKPKDGKLVVSEEVAIGHVKWGSLALFLSSLAGSYRLLFWMVFLAGLTMCDVGLSFQTWWMGHWAEQYDLRDASQVSIPFYLTVYVLILLSSLSVFCIGSTVYVFGSLRASKKIHRRLIQSVLGTTLRWLDTTPTSRVITRCTQDIRAVDGPIAESFSALVEVSIGVVVKLVAVIMLTPVFLMPGVLIAVMGGYCGRIYMKATMSVKREMSNAKAPVVGHFGAAIAGLTSIRAYGAQLAFRQESYKRIDSYIRASRTFYNLNRWVSFRIDILGGIFSAALGAYMVYGPGKGTLSSNAGFSINMAVSFSNLLFWWVRLVNMFEVQANSLERIKSYIDIEQEPKATKDGVPPAYWPASGDLKVDNLSARYSEDGPRVLHEVSFHIKSGERVGVVGRTGSGKSTLTLALLRCILAEGNVYYDGLPTSSVNLDSLRSKITIIPQMPELLSGTLRENLDPFGEYDDATLNNALRAAGLFSLQVDTDDSRVTLDSAISGGGSNLSTGQRQILALARAIVRGSKLLILDEATSAIDYQTDTIIQSSLRHELKGDVTLLTVAHRLQTIMDFDKIMVLDAGRIVEFDKPSELLKKEGGQFRSLVDESGDKDALYAMVSGSK
ncbi:P-loop containing nucleoside triphosphate hydrolase protein [Artomyces pyxidatus]|uniref:P-loop containing nucleoside triphosphate hydrolase protein n=1 Tax=Artomyces pyxidatus TaxID=48021 RepID=A0ACB8TI15_9AGAM|nr:P-loop containing nucleoside triphosphate hydrolase protein [Artomyces pyxidatus]